MSSIGPHGLLSTTWPTEGPSVRLNEQPADEASAGVAAETRSTEPDVFANEEGRLRPEACLLSTRPKRVGQWSVSDGRSVLVIQWQCLAQTHISSVAVDRAAQR